MGLPSDSESDHSPTSDSEDSEEQEEGPPTANASQGSLPTPALPRSQLTTSIISQVSAPGAAAQADNSEDKRSKFDEQFKTATSTDEEVLSMLFFRDVSVMNLDRPFGREANGDLDLSSLPALQDSPNYFCQEWKGCLCLYLHCICLNANSWPRRLCLRIEVYQSKPPHENRIMGC